MKQHDDVYHLYPGRRDTARLAHRSYCSALHYHLIRPHPASHRRPQQPSPHPDPARYSDFEKHIAPSYRPFPHLHPHSHYPQRASGRRIDPFRIQRPRPSRTASDSGGICGGRARSRTMRVGFVTGYERRGGGVCVVMQGLLRVGRRPAGQIWP